MTAFFVYCDIYKEKEQHGVALTYECNEQSTAELQKLSVFHTTVTYATAKIHILFEMDNQNTEHSGNNKPTDILNCCRKSVGLCIRLSILKR